MICFCRRSERRKFDDDVSTTLIWVRWNVKNEIVVSSLLCLSAYQSVTLTVHHSSIDLLPSSSFDFHICSHFNNRQLDSSSNIEFMIWKFEDFLNRRRCDFPANDISHMGIFSINKLNYVCFNASLICNFILSGGRTGNVISHENCSHHQTFYY